MAMLGTAIVGVFASAASGSPPPADRANKKLQLPLAEPLPMRDANSPTSIVRELVLLQERATRGDTVALGKQPAVVADLSRKLLQLERQNWKDARNREALIKFVLSGGDPAALIKVREWGMFLEIERRLATGALAYAQGSWRTSIEALGEIDARRISLTLGGVVALVQAILVGDGDHAKALSYCDEARLLSPGTIVEETALRLSIEFAIAASDRKRLEVAVMRYAYRFSRSLYAGALDAQLVPVLAGVDTASNPGEAQFLARLFEQITVERRQALMVAVSRAALASGRLATAAAVGQLMLKSTGADASTVALGKALVGASLVVGGRRNEGVKLLEQIERAENPRDLTDLIRGARSVARLIEAPPDLISESPNAQPSNPSNMAEKKIRAVFSEADKSLDEVSR